MSFHDTAGPVAPTDAGLATRLKRQLSQSVSTARSTIERGAAIIARAPGGKAGIVAQLGADAQAMVNAYADLATYANTHKDAGVDDVTAPLVQGDLA
jgi:hypothetical protein